MSAKRGQQNLNASIKKDAALKRMRLQDAQKKLEDEQKKLQDEQAKMQDANPARTAADNTLSNFLLLPDAPALGSEPSSSTVTLTPSVVHGDQGAPETTADTTPTVEHGAKPAPETEADTTVGSSSRQDRRRHSERIANAPDKSCGKNETHGSSYVNTDDDNYEDDDVSEDENRTNKTGEGRTPTKSFAVIEKRGRGRPFKSPSQQGIYARSHHPLPNPDTFFLRCRPPCIQVPCI